MGAVRRELSFNHWNPVARTVLYLEGGRDLAVHRTLV